MKLVEIHFPVTMDLHKKKKNGKKDVFQVSCSHRAPVTQRALKKKIHPGFKDDTSSSIPRAKIKKRKHLLKEMGTRVAHNVS